MNHRLLFIISGLIVLSLIVCMNGSAQNETPRLDNSMFANPQRPGAVFDHDTHNEMAELEENCTACHHVYENKTIIEDESSEDTPCGDCHGLKPTPENSVPLRKAFHGRCKSCHFTSKKGPVLCGECHIKQGR